MGSNKQTKYVRGAHYTVIGPAKLERKLVHVGKFIHEGDTLLVFRHFRKKTKGSSKRK